MNTLRQTCAAAILSLALAVSAFAGQIDSPGYVPPPPGNTQGPTVAATILLTIITWPR